MRKFMSVTLMLVLVSCKETVLTDSSFYFDSPQPVNDSELTAIPAKFRGVYLDDETTLQIMEKGIFRDTPFETTLHKAELDSIEGRYNLKEGKLTTHNPDRVYNAVTIGDSIHLSTITRDTLFIFSPRQKAKRLHGQIVLSTKDSTFWKVNILKLEEYTLKWKYFNDQEDYSKLSKLIKDLEANDDTTFVHVRPTRKEFIRLLNNRELGLEEKYKKLN